MLFLVLERATGAGCKEDAVLISMVYADMKIPKRQRSDIHIGVGRLGSELGYQRLCRQAVAEKTRTASKRGYRSGTCRSANGEARSKTQDMNSN